MNNSENYAQLLKVLLNCNDTSTDPLIIKASDLDEETLNKFNIIFEKQKEGFFVDLSSQVVKIFKNKHDSLTYIQEDDEQKSILIINEQLIYLPTKSKEVFLCNLFFVIKLKKLLLENDVISYHDVTNKNFIFLSELMGKVEVGYKNKLLDFCNGDYNLSLAEIQNKFTENEYLSFFRDNFIKAAKKYENPADRFYLALKEIAIIFEDSNREFELYKNKFSFEKFQSNLEKEKEKYIKNIQENLFEFQSKISSLPIQFGVYLFLAFRFQGEIIPLFAVNILIITWSTFTLYLLQIMQDAVTHTRTKITGIFNEISSESGINISQEKTEISTQLSKIQDAINFFRFIVVIFSCILVLFISSNIFDVYNENKSIEKIEMGKLTLKAAPSIRDHDGL